MNFKSRDDRCCHDGISVPPVDRSGKVLDKMIYVIDDPPRVLVDLIYAVLRSTRGYIDPWSPRVLAASMVNLRLDLLANHVAETAPCADHDGN